MVDRVIKNEEVSGALFKQFLNRGLKFSFLLLTLTLVKNSMLKKIFLLAKKHKFLTVIIVLAATAGGYFAYNSLIKTGAQTSYVLAAVQKGTLVSSISGSGQVSASNQIDIKPKASGDVTFVGVTNGQEVKAGTIIARLDSQDALKAIRDAQVNLDSARLSLAKLNQPADALSLMQAENALSDAQQSRQKTDDDLQRSYDDGFNTASNAFLDLPTIMTGLQTVLFDDSITTYVSNIDYYADAAKVYDEKANQYRNQANSVYQKARTEYDQNFEDYKSASRFSDTQTIESLISQTYDTTKDIAEAIKSANNLIQFYEDTLRLHDLKPQVTADTQLTTLGGYTGKTNSHLGNLLSSKTGIQNSKNSLQNADRSIIEKTASLEKLKSGADALDLQSQELTIKQRENALLDAREKLNDYVIRAPFDGVIVALNIKKGDAASSGTAVATLITKQRVAEISLNEVDAAEVKTGQKATLTFDAIDGLSISGQVAQIDALGTVTQGVVSYNVKLSFDTQDDRVKPGMSASAQIITDVKQDALYVPNSAIKTADNSQYVQVLDQPQTSSTAQISQGVTSLLAPREVTVQTGISNDTSTEITSGLKEGDQIISRTVSSTATQTTTQQNSLFGGGSGTIRAIGR
ncbi:MAG: efflux RND transporter periplasmic adaptor subunit [bacterium]